MVLFVKVNLSFSSEVSREIPIIPGFLTGVGTMIYAGSIGTQIANELIDSSRCFLGWGWAGLYQTYVMSMFLYN